MFFMEDKEESQEKVSYERYLIATGGAAVAGFTLGMLAGMLIVTASPSDLEKEINARYYNYLPRGTGAIVYDHDKNLDGILDRDEIHDLFKNHVLKKRVRHPERMYEPISKEGLSPFDWD